MFFGVDDKGRKLTYIINKPWKLYIPEPIEWNLDSDPNIAYWV